MGLNDLVPFRHRRGRTARSGALAPFERMHEEMDRLFEDLLPQMSGGRDDGQPVGALASVDLSETADALELGLSACQALTLPQELQKGPRLRFAPRFDFDG